MSSMTFGQKSFSPTPPDKGSFPLDHEGRCKKLMLKYMICLRDTRNINSKCRQEIKDYLACRMDNNLMAKEDWSKLGLDDALKIMEQVLENYLSQIGTPSEKLKKLRSADSTTSEVIHGIPELSGLSDSLTVLVCGTGSVATIKLPLLITQLHNAVNKVKLQVILTDRAKHFCPQTDLKNLPIDGVYTDYEWNSWTYPEKNSSLHDELAKQANILLIAPLDANTLAKIANGLCDNLLTSLVRVWDFSKKVAICCPAMNTQMWVHPITDIHIKQVKSLGFVVIPPIAKKLMCGDVGVGAMAEPGDIVSVVKHYF